MSSWFDVETEIAVILRQERERVLRRIASRQHGEAWEGLESWTANGTASVHAAKPPSTELSVV